MDTPYPPTPSSCLSTFVGGLFIDPILPSSFLNCISSDSNPHSSFSPTSFTSNFSDSFAVFSDSSLSLQTKGFRCAFLSITLKREKIVPNFSDSSPSAENAASEGSGNQDNTPPAAASGGSATRTRGKRAMNSTKHLWSGAVAAMVSRTFVAPLERLKLEYIVRGEKRQMLELVRTIATTQGLGGFWKGNLLNILRTAPFKAINFYSYDLYRKQLHKITVNEEMKHMERFIAGAAAGITATVLCLPLDTIRTRIVARGGEQLGGVIGALVHMVRTEGFFSLYKGLLPSIMSMAPSSAVFYGVYDILKSAYLRSPEGCRRIQKMKHQGQEMTAFDQLELGTLRTLLYGAISGACAEAATYPFEVLRRQLQMQVKTNKANTLVTFVNIVQQRGVLGLYAGLLPSLLQNPGTAGMRRGERVEYFILQFKHCFFEANIDSYLAPVEPTTFKHCGNGAGEPALLEVKRFTDQGSVETPPLSHQTYAIKIVDKEGAPDQGQVLPFLFIQRHIMFLLTSLLADSPWCLLTNSSI